MHDATKVDYAAYESNINRKFYDIGKGWPFAKQAELDDGLDTRILVARKDDEITDEQTYKCRSTLFVREDHIESVKDDLNEIVRAKDYKNIEIFSAYDDAKINLYELLSKPDKKGYTKWKGLDCFQEHSWG